MPDVPILEFEAQDHQITFRARLLADENPDVVEQILAMLPFKSVLGHVVVSGEAIWLPTKIVHLGRNNMVTRSPGAVYFYAPGQSLCLTYGAITESAPVNKFGQVFEEDMGALRALGEIVWNKTVEDVRKELVMINIRSVA